VTDMGGTPTDVDALLAKAISLEARMDSAKRWLDANLRKDPELARRLIKKMLPEAESSGDVSGKGWLLFQSGWLHLDADEYEQGCALLESARSLFETAGERAGVARCLNALGRAYDRQGIFDLAIELYRETINLSEEVERTDIAGAASMNLAQSLFELGESGEALAVIEHCEQHYSIAPHNRAIAHYQKGSAYRALGRLEEAERTLMDGVAMAAGASRDALDLRCILAETLMDRGRLDIAGRLICKGLKDAVSAGERHVWIRLALAQTRFYLLQGNSVEAVSVVQDARKTASDLGVRKFEAEAERLLYKAYQASGAYEEALAAFERYSEMKDAIRNEQAARRISGLHTERSRREARHFEALYRQIAAISEVGRRIASHLDLESALTTIQNAISGLMDASTIILALVDEEKQLLDYRFILCRGERRESFVCPLDKQSFGCLCVKNRSDIIIGDVESEYSQYVPSYKELVFEDISETSLVYIPLLLEERVVGMLSVQSTRQHAYDQQKVKILYAIGGYIAISIANSRLFEQVERLASTDELTALPNRRTVMEELAKVYRRTRRYGRLSGVVMTDVDHFKRVNDIYGHDVGDVALRSIAGALASSVRESDMVGRFGGEEFIVVLQETDVKGALLLAERLRKTVEELEIEGPHGEILRVTASFGVSMLSPKDPDCHAALKRADDALYEAKSTGRNRVCSRLPEDADA